MKKNLLLFIFSLCFVLLSSGYASAQGIVSGIVKDNTGTLPGVSVQIKGTTQGTLTDIDGKFSINVQAPNSVLVFSFIGYLPQEVLIQGQKTLEITLEQSATKLDEFVVVGYGVQRKSDLTGATSRLSGDNLNKGVASSPVEMMQGRVTGVNVAQNNGEPGAGMTVRVRGSSSIRSGMDPLYVVDGVPLDNQDLTPAGGSVSGMTGSENKNPISFLNPDDIATIDILKDASSTAIYGSRASNGVIMITTKKGDQGAGKLSYDGYTGLSTITKKLDVLSADQFRAYRKADGTALPDGGASNNWQDEIFRTAFTQSHNFSFGGGTKNHTYRASLGYLDQQGIVKTTEMQRVNGKLSVTQKAFHDKLELSANLIASHVKDRRAPVGLTGGFEGDGILTALKLNPTYPIYNADGTYHQETTDQRNPVAMINLTNDVTLTDQIVANASGEYAIFKDLKYKLNIGYTLSSVERKINQDKQLSYLQSNGEADINSIEATNALVENYLTYAKTINDHQLNVLLGMAYQNFNVYGQSLNVKGFVANDVVYTDNPAFGNLAGATQSFYANTNDLQSFFGRFNYNYEGKYLLTVTARADGSTKFGENNHYGFYPSAAFAWRLSDEDFIKDMDVFSNLKLRLGWGQTGNQEIPNKISQISVGTSSSANGFFNGTLSPGITFQRVPNPNIQWETTEQTDFGLDLGFLKNRLTATVDVFFKKTKDVLLQITSAIPAPASTVWLNVPDLRIINNGVELGVNGILVEKADLTWDAGVNFSYIKNNVTDMPVTLIETGNANGQGLSGTRVQIITNDNPVGTFYGRVFEGYDANGVSIYKKDAKGNDALEILGSALPMITYSFNTKLQYKALDCSMFWYGVSGNKIYNNAANALFVRGSLEKGANITNDALNSPQGVADANAFSSKYVEDGSFFRFANLSVGYTFNTKSIKWIDKARIYATGNNLLVLTKYTGFDPEVSVDASQNGVPSMGIDYTCYPKARVFTVGVNLNF